MTKNKQIPYYVKTSDVIKYIESLSYAKRAAWGDLGKIEWLMFFSMADPEIEYNEFVRLLNGFSSNVMVGGFDKVPKMLHDWARKHKYRMNEDVKD